MIDIKRLEEIALNSSAADTHEEEQIARELLTIRRAALDMPSAVEHIREAAHTKGEPVSAQTIIELRDAAWAARLAAKDEEIARLRDVLTNLVALYETCACDTDWQNDEATCPHDFARVALAGGSK